MIRYWSALVASPVFRSLCSDFKLAPSDSRWFRVGAVRNAGTKVRGWAYRSKEPSDAEDELEEDKDEDSHEFKKSEQCEIPKDKMQFDEFQMESMMGNLMTETDEAFKGESMAPENEPFETGYGKDVVDIEEGRKLSRPKITRLPKLSFQLSLALAARYSDCKANPMRPLVLVPGKRVISELLYYGINPKAVFSSRFDSFQQIQFPDSVKRYTISPKEFSMCLPFLHPSGLQEEFVATYLIGDLQLKSNTRKTIPFTIVCNSVKNQSHLADLMTTAGVIGCQRVILTKGCNSIYTSPYLKSSLHACLTVPVTFSESWENIKKNISPSASIFIIEPADEKIAKTVDDEPPHERPTSSIDYPHIPKVSCFSDLCSDPLMEEVVIVAGSSINKNAYELCHLLKGKRIFLPYQGDCGTDLSMSPKWTQAAFTIAYELSRQWRERCKVPGRSTASPANERYEYQGVGLYME